MKSKIIYLGIAVFMLVMQDNANAYSLIGRLGLGTSNQFQTTTDMQALTVKVQRSRRTSIGALMAVSANSGTTNYGFGLKVYRIIYDEPQLNFYSAFMFGIVSENDSTGYQADATFGTEFHFQGIESIGFSFEFGISLNKYDSGTTFETVGLNLVQAAVHFYL
jgi:hypothetical protein